MRSTRRRSTSAKHPARRAAGTRSGCRAARRAAARHRPNAGPDRRRRRARLPAWPRPASYLLISSRSDEQRSRTAPAGSAAARRSAPAAASSSSPGLEQDLRRHLDGGQRGPQLVRDVGDELPLRLGQFLQLAQLALQAGRHLVERGRQRRQVIRAAHLHPLVQVAGRQPLRRLRRVPDRQHHPAGDQRGDRGQQHDERQSRPPTRVRCTTMQERLLLGEREDVVQLVVLARAARRRPGRGRRCPARRCRLSVVGCDQRRGRGVVVVLELPPARAAPADQCPRDGRGDVDVALAHPLTEGRRGCWSAETKTR